MLLNRVLHFAKEIPKLREASRTREYKVCEIGKMRKKNNEFNKNIVIIEGCEHEGT